MILKLTESGAFTKSGSITATASSFNNLSNLDIPAKSSRARALSIQPKSPEISVDSSNGTDHFGLVRPEYSGPALKVFHCDRSGHFGRSDRNAPFHLLKLLSPVPLFSILLTRPSSFQSKVKCCE